MPLTYKEAKIKLFGSDHVVKPGTPDFSKIRELMKKENEAKPPPQPRELRQSKLSEPSPINVVKAVPPPPPIMTKAYMFHHNEQFKEHHVRYLESVRVGNARLRPLKTQNNSVSTVEQNATKASD